MKVWMVMTGMPDQTWTTLFTTRAAAEDYARAHASEILWARATAPNWAQLVEQAAEYVYETEIYETAAAADTADALEAHSGSTVASP